MQLCKRLCHSIFSNSVAFGAPLRVHKVDDISIVIEDALACSALVLSSMSVCVHVGKVFYTAALLR